MEQWQKVFIITAAQLIVCGVLYTLFAQSELQPWNSPEGEAGAARTATAADRDLERKQRGGSRGRLSLPAIVVSGSEHELYPLRSLDERDD